MVGVMAVSLKTSASVTRGGDYILRLEIQGVGIKHRYLITLSFQHCSN